MAAQTFAQGPPAQQIMCNNLEVGLSWDLVRKDDPVDLDLSCVYFNEYGKVLDVAFYNQLTTSDGSATQMGDSRDGKEGGDDEQLVIDLAKVHPDVKAMVVAISCYTSHTLSHIETGVIEVRDQSTRVVLNGINFDNFNQSTAAIIYTFFRGTGGYWYLQPIFQQCNGQTFEDFKEPMRESLSFIINPLLMQEMQYDISNEKRFDLSKGKVVNMKGLDRVKMGLGWDTNCDVDASCVLMEEGKICDTVYYGKLASKCKSVTHSGDNLDGKGDGDDEQIRVRLSKIPDNVTSLLFTVNIYENGYSFKNVKGLFVRMINSKTRKTICKYKIGHMSGASKYNAMVVCKVFRYNNTWRFMAIGDFGTGRTAVNMKDVLPMYASPSYVPT